MTTEELREQFDELKQEASAIQLMRFLKEELVDEMEAFPVEDSDSNEHRLNMLIRDLEEDLDRIENSKLGDWDPESV